MKDFFRIHSEAVLISFAALFLAVIIGFLYGTLTVVFSEIDRAIESNSAQSIKGFDLQTAAQINFRGLLDTGTAQTPQQNIILPPLLMLPVSTPATATTTPSSIATFPTSTPAVATSTNSVAASSSVPAQAPAAASGTGTTTTQ